MPNMIIGIAKEFSYLLDRPIERILGPQKTKRSARAIRTFWNSIFEELTNPSLLFSNTKIQDLKNKARIPRAM